jgi:hypothetical protein
LKVTIRCGVPESSRNIVARYNEIEELCPEEIDDAALPYFVDWLTKNVHLVEITAYSDDVAYTIFETMNDRCLSTHYPSVNQPAHSHARAESLATKWSVSGPFRTAAFGQARNPRAPSSRGLVPESRGFVGVGAGTNDRNVAASVNKQGRGTWPRPLKLPD